MDVLQSSVWIVLIKYVDIYTLVTLSRTCKHLHRNFYFFNVKRSEICNTDGVWEEVWFQISGEKKVNRKSIIEKITTIPSLYSSSNHHTRGFSYSFHFNGGQFQMFMKFGSIEYEINGEFTSVSNKQVKTASHCFPAIIKLKANKFNAVDGHDGVYGFAFSRKWTGHLSLENNLITMKIQNSLELPYGAYWPPVLTFVQRATK